MYEKQVVQWAESGLSAGPPRPRRAGFRRGAAGQRGIAAARRDPFHALTVSRAPDSPVVIALGRDAGVLLVNGYTGQIIGPVDWAFGRSSGTSPSGIAGWGAAATGARPAARSPAPPISRSSACVLSGMYIWLPRFWTWRQIRGLMWFRRSGTPRRATSTGITSSDSGPPSLSLSSSPLVS